MLKLQIIDIKMNSRFREKIKKFIAITLRSLGDLFFEAEKNTFAQFKVKKAFLNQIKNFDFNEICRIH